jgi:light-regulated signal transduction histidine kinase (bacteriophytochrome)
MGDRRLLFSVFQNLLGNAWKFTRTQEHPVIEFACELQGDYIICHVKDNGVGFDMKYADKLFGVFQRLHPDKEYQGTGVGLAIVQRIIHRHGGKVWAEAQEGKGASFFFTLPAVIEDSVVASLI